jgi:hypothetical protein
VQLLFVVLFLLCINDLSAQSPGKPTVNCKRSYDKRIMAEVYDKPTRLPEFPGGNRSFMRFLIKNFRYPDEEVESGQLQSTTVATFIVDSIGVLRCIGIKGKKEVDWSPFEKAFVKVLGESGIWKPGECNGRRVAAYFEQPIEVIPETSGRKNGL